MPRDGSNVYHRPSGTDGIPNTPVQSAPYNTYTADIEQDLNLPRPIVAGGTAATSADVALLNLSAEKAKQVVTNWDSMVWLAGSFYAATTASGTAPVAAHAFAGVVYYANATDFVLQAVDLTDANHPQFIRVMSGGVWGAWAADDASVYVKKAGDTMTGDLTINSAFLTVSAAAPSLNLTRSAAGNATGIMSRLGAALRWIILPGDTTAESGSNVGSDFVVQAYTDAAAPVTPPAITIKRASNRLLLAGDPVAALDAATKQYADAITTALTAANTTQDTAIANRVRYDAAQALTTPQKAQARSNITSLGNVVVQIFTASGTYTPTAGMVCATIECVGGGGSGGNTTSTAGGQLSASSGGGGGAYARARVTAAAVGASQVVTVGAGAAATGGGGNPGAAGTGSSVGALCSAGGGAAGLGCGAAAATFTMGGAGGTATIGDILIRGSAAQAAVSMGSNVLPSMGGASGCGFGAGGVGNNGSAGGAASLYGGGGGGTALGPSAAALSGGGGAAGIVIVTEFLP